MPLLYMYTFWKLKGQFLHNGLVKLIESVKIALLFLHVMLKLFQFTI